MDMDAKPAKEFTHAYQQTGVSCADAAAAFDRLM